MSNPILFSYSLEKVNNQSFNVISLNLFFLFPVTKVRATSKLTYFAAHRTSIPLLQCKFCYLHLAGFEQWAQTRHRERAEATNNKYYGSGNSQTKANRHPARSQCPIHSPQHMHGMDSAQGCFDWVTNKFMILYAVGDPQLILRINPLHQVKSCLIGR